MALQLLDYSAFITLQLIVYIGCYYGFRRKNDIKNTLLAGVMIGIVAGSIFDYIVGVRLSIYEYALGFGAPFLLINAALSFGIFTANTLLLRDLRTQNFLVWLVTIAITYETANKLFPVWKWKAPLHDFPLACLILMGYVGYAVFILIIYDYLFREYDPATTTQNKRPILGGK